MLPGGEHRSITDPSDLADTYGPALARALGGSLGEIAWFHGRHQRGGAATGFAAYRIGGDRQIPVVVKFPVGEVEFHWTTALGAVQPDHWDDRWALTLPTPRVIAYGTHLEGAHLPWIVTERLGPGRHTSSLTPDDIEDLLRATADFQAAAMKVAPLAQRPPSPDWQRKIELSRELARAGGLPDSHRWLEVVKRVARALPTLSRRWDARPINSWCHGDLHADNALRRPLPPDLPDPDLVNRHGCVLIDLAMVHPGHWAEDALYLERQYWGHTDHLGSIKPVPFLARLRRERGLPADDSYGDMALVKRVLTAACAPAMMDREGNPKYLAAALSVVERHLPQVSK